jgi:hypothetical protein
MNRALTRKDIEAAWQAMAPVAIDEFNSKGEVSPKLFMLTFGDQPGEVASFGAFDPRLIYALFHKELSHGKDIFAELVRQLVTDGSTLREQLADVRPDMVVQITEAWMQNVRGKTKEQAEAEFEKYGSVEAMPTRQEAIILIFHSQDCSVMGTCPITDNPRHAEIGQLQPAQGARLTGRMSMSPENRS